MLNLYMNNPSFFYMKDIITIYKKYKLCKSVNRQFVECMNNFILKDKKENCNISYDILKKNNCI